MNTPFKINDLLIKLYEKIKNVYTVKPLTTFK